MKKIISAACIAMGVISMSSCSDFLDQKSPSELETTDVYNSTYYTELRVNKIYGGLTQDRTYSQDLAIVWNLNSDIELVDGLGDDATNTTSERGNMNYNASPAWSKISGVWDAIYGVIEDANDVVAGVRNSNLLTNGSTSEQQAMKRYLGEALTLRAMCYLDLVRFFGDVPFKTEPSKSDLSNAYLSKTDRDEILDQLLVDLEEAVEMLPWADEVGGYTTERITKGYAHGLLAQIAMTRAGYAIREKAKEGYETASYSDATYPTQRPAADVRTDLYARALKHLSAIINNGTHQLNPSFENQWYLINQLQLDKTYHENLFEIPMGRNVTGELGYTVGVRMNGVTTEYGYGNSSGKLKLTAPLLYSYDKNDLRRDITIAAFEIKQDGKNTIESLLGNAPFGLYCAKWDCRKMSNEWLQENLKATAKHMTGVNPVKMRYSQVLLYYAECLNELAGPEGSYQGDAGITALQALALVHNRAFSEASIANNYMNNVPRTKEGFFEALVQENAWEFAGEGYRKWDLIRWNLLVDRINAFKQTYLNDLQSGKYPDKLYFNYSDAEQTKIDMNSVTWYSLPSNPDDYAGSVDGFGKSAVGTGKDKQVDTNLPTISSGLVGDGVVVKNRYLMPIASTTISASNGKLHNSYGYND
ncbi:MAG: RagB/SusD family nutrient uptake outer membrane protein [Prevotella sp.]|nr:RagB/SusD family nutrient uptake outer membrane protein [Bacteroidales bacterium]MDY2692805.1 RagB/SusD family nutrient uptake outer membrane protein [Prevotella sp.]MDY4732609.1 RagB/SusD family nutrient uptake outer membrane protein [Prevotella sp.]